MLPNPSIHNDWSSWAKQVQQIITPFMASVETSFFRQGRIPRMASFNVAALPSATSPGELIFCPDETGGATILFSDGTNWRRVQDRSVAA